MLLKANDLAFSKSVYVCSCSVVVTFLITNLSFSFVFEAVAYNFNDVKDKINSYENMKYVLTIFYT